jgi:hypothetical protein
MITRYAFFEGNVKTGKTSDFRNAVNDRLGVGFSDATRGV